MACMTSLDVIKQRMQVHKLPGRSMCHLLYDMLRSSTWQGNCHDTQWRTLDVTKQRLQASRPFPKMISTDAVKGVGVDAGVMLDTFGPLFGWRGMQPKLDVQSFLIQHLEAACFANPPQNRECPEHTNFCGSSAGATDCPVFS